MKIELILQIYKAHVISQFNFFIYYLQKLPFIGPKLPNRLYDLRRLKQAGSAISYIASLFTNFIGKILYLLILSIGAGMLAKFLGLDERKTFMHLFFVLTFIIGSIMHGSSVLELDRWGFVFVKIFRTDPRVYFPTNILYKHIIKLIPMTLVMFALVPYIGIAIWKIPLIGLALLGIRLGVETLNILIYNRIPGRDKLLNQIILFGSILLGNIYLYTSFSLKNIPNWIELITAVPFLIGAVAIGVLSLFFLLNTNRYTIITRNAFSMKTVQDINTAMEMKSFIGENVKAEKYRVELNEKTLGSKTGYALIHEVMFQRLRVVFLNPIRNRLIAITVVSVALFILWFIFKIKLTNNSKDAAEFFTVAAPAILFLLMYSLSTGEKFTRALFYHMDMVMLKYRFYREPQAILESFRIRFLRCFLLNMIPSTLLIIIFTVLFFMAGNVPFWALAFDIAAICVLTCFFSFHYLIVYYLLQPYTAQMEMKNPFVLIINSGIFLISIIIMNRAIKLSLPFLLVVFALMIIYVIVGIIVAYKKAPKTFRLK